MSIATGLSGGVTVRVPAARAKPLHVRLPTSLRYLLDNQELLLNRLDAAGWLVSDELWLVVKTALDRLRAHLEQQGQAGIPSDDRRIMDELQQRGVRTPCGGRAVWRAVVALGEWRQKLTMLNFPAVKIWPDPEARPTSVQGTVDLVTEKESDETNDVLVGTSPIKIADESTVTISDAHVATCSATTDVLAQLESTSEELEPPEPEPQVGSDSSQLVTIATPVNQVQKSTPGPPFPGMAEEKPCYRNNSSQHNPCSCALCQRGPAASKSSYIQGLCDGRKRPMDQRPKTFSEAEAASKNPDGFNIWTCQVKGKRRINC